MATIKNGSWVSIKDENGQAVVGVLRCRDQANDGTGRHGYLVAVVRDGVESVYWRATVRRAAEPLPHCNDAQGWDDYRARRGYAGGR